MKYTLNNYILDEDQTNIVFNNNPYVLVVAGAGSGKTLTILGKIKYLIENNYSNKDILCISYTVEASNSLKNKIKQEINQEISVYTFHKLAIEILKKQNDNICICENELLDIVIDNYFRYDIIYNKRLLYYACKLFKINKKEYSNIFKMPIYKNVCNNINSFIKLYKTSGKNILDFKYILKNAKLYKIINSNNYYYMINIFNIFLEYEKCKNDEKELDFDDIIVNATNLIKHNIIKLNYKYIIVDEYQDSSDIRFNLINAIVEQCNAKLLVVGDDFQSIYRFSGSNLNLFINFNNYYKNGIILFIRNTYRNSRELIQIAGDFVMKNNMQIKKILNSNKRCIDPINIIFYQNARIDFIKLLDFLHDKNIKNIFVLGRFNNDINYILSDDLVFDGEYIKYKDMSIRYLTMHKSKGLEEENVIIINFKTGEYGFPSTKKNNSIFKYIDKKRHYKYDEERRLFYVGLTRTMNKCFLFVPQNNYSIFIKELLYYNKIKTITLK